MMRTIIKIVNNIETYLCRVLLVTFVTLLFLQIVSREIFNYPLTWSEELSVYLFVWFVFFGASHAARLSAHNRVTFQYRWFPEKLKVLCELLSDLAWIFFNCYFIYLSYDFVFNRMNLFWKSQTLGIPMKYIYLILPIAFTLMTLRIIQVNYLKYIRGVDIEDPESKEMQELMDGTTADNKNHATNG